MSVDVEAYLEQLKHVAFVHNSDLSMAWQADIFSEGKRLLEDVMLPGGQSNRTILIVGGAGYIGGPVTADMLARGYSVKWLDILMFENAGCVSPFIGHPNFEFIYGDLANEDDVNKALEGVTDVIILAGLVGDPITKKYPEASDAINLHGMERMIDSMNGRGLNKVVFVSTCSNYGEIPEDAIADENYELKPLSLYAKAKVAMEIKFLGSKGKVDYCPTVTRFSTAFGLSTRMRFDLTVSEFTREVALSNTLEVYDADTWRPYCHVRDFSRGLLRVLESPSDKVAFEVFNAGGDVNNYTKGMIVETIKEFLPDAKIKYVEGGFDRRNYRVNFAKIQKALDFTPVYTVPDGICELIAAMGQKLFADVEARPNFYGNRVVDYPPAG